MFGIRHLLSVIHESLVLGNKLAIFPGKRFITGSWVPRLGAGLPGITSGTPCRTDPGGSWLRYPGVGSKQEITGKLLTQTDFAASVIRTWQLPLQRLPRGLGRCSALVRPASGKAYAFHVHFPGPAQMLSFPFRT